MSGQSLVVPLVLWGRQPPTHCVSSLYMTPDLSHVVTGCNDGQVVVWEVDNTLKMKARNMFFGHTAAITAIASGSCHEAKPYIVCSSDNGEMSLWDLKENRCLEFTKYPFTHTNIQSYQMIQCRDLRLVCNGYYPEIHIIHPLTLEILFSLSSRIQPDWISALCVIRPVKREEDVLVAMSNSGTVKVWSITGTESKVSQPIYEDEAKQIRCLNAHTLRCCPYNQRTILIVCAKYWQIYDSNFVTRDRPKRDADGVYDAGDFSLLCSESSRRSERWMGGDFIAIDKVVVWSSEGKSYLYKLPTNIQVLNGAIPGSPDYRKPANPQNPSQSGPQAYNMLEIANEKPLSCSPAMLYFHGRRSAEIKLLLRGDSEGRIAVWVIPEVSQEKMKLVRQESFYRLPAIQPRATATLQQNWDCAQPKVEGIIDQLLDLDGKVLDITSSIYLPSQGKLACGREDGSIVIVAAVYCLSLQLLNNSRLKDSLHHQILVGHKGRVNCLLYPYNDSTRYDPSLLVSGGMDFSVILWDISTGSKTHTFNVHAGEVSRLMTPPDTCNNRVLSCICSVASDHSLALLSVKEYKPVLLASRQMFPILTVKWRPLDDFIIIACTDGSVYVWQMETGHLDRVVNGVTAEEILSACDEKLVVSHDLTNPTLSIAQAFKRHNIATFKTFAQQRLHHHHDKSDKVSVHSSLMTRPDAHPMMIQGLRTNSKDPDSHVLMFDAEALIVQLLSEEFSMLSPETLQSCGVLVAADNQQNIHLSDAEKKIAGFFAKVKDKAEDVGRKIEMKAESAGLKPVSPSLSRRSSGAPSSPSQRPRQLKAPEQSLTLEIAQLFMSCLHAWGYDTALDELCIKKLGLTPPKCAVTFGVLSRGGYMSLLLPDWHTKYPQDNPVTVSCSHWQICRSLTTQQLLAIISVANTLMSINNATFVPGVSDKQRVFKNEDDVDAQQVQAESKQAWSLLAALHCVLLPDLIGSNGYNPPLLEMLARRWQDRCLEIREAAQALLLAELRRIGQAGRKAVVDEWSAYLPSYVDPAYSLMGDQAQQQQQATDQDHDHDQILEGDDISERCSQSFESRRKQAMAIVMMGVLGAEFGQELEPSKAKKTAQVQPKQKVVEGFELANYSHARHTSNALTFLLQQPASSKLPAYTPIRRAAIDLLGRGFTVWEPYLDVSAVLLGLLEMCVDADKLIPSMTFGLPLSPQADACRTSRHALSLIATARPKALIITLAKEVARHNALLQSSHQMQHPQLNQSVLVRAKAEILHILELLVDKIPNEVVDLLVEVMDITVHCLDASNIRSKGLQELFPAICRFSMVSFCVSSRRIGVGAKNGGVALYELKQSRSQILAAHKAPVTALAFSPDGKFLASYCIRENTLLFFQTGSTSMFGIGTQHTRCVKSYQVPPVTLTSSTNPLKVARIIWLDNRTVVVLTVDGKESKFRV